MTFLRKRLLGPLCIVFGVGHLLTYKTCSPRITNWTFGLSEVLIKVRCVSIRSARFPSDDDSWKLYSTEFFSEDTTCSEHMCFSFALIVASEDVLLILRQDTPESRFVAHGISTFIPPNRPSFGDDCSFWLLFVIALNSFWR